MKLAPWRRLRPASLGLKTYLTLWMRAIRKRVRTIRLEVWPVRFEESLPLMSLEMFRLFADNNQCKHIFFAGCHDSGYSNLLTPYRGRTDRITLLKGAGFHSEYERLDLPVRELPSVFMSTSLGGNGSMISNHTASPSNTSRSICKHFQKVR